MLTKTEQKILNQVRQGNQRGAFVGLGTDPRSPNFFTRGSRFLKRLFDNGSLLYMPYSHKFGDGWCLPEFAEHFKSNGYVPHTYNYHYIRNHDHAVFTVMMESHWSDIYNIEGAVPIRYTVKWIGANQYVSHDGERFTRIPNTDTTS